MAMRRTLSPEATAASEKLEGLPRGPDGVCQRNAYKELGEAVAPFISFSIYIHSSTQDAHYTVSTTKMGLDS